MHRFILFTSSVEQSLQPLSEAWAQLGAEQLEGPMPVLHGSVDTAKDQHLAERFRITSVPTFLLFRDRKVTMGFCTIPACMQGIFA